MAKNHKPRSKDAFPRVQFFSMNDRENQKAFSEKEKIEKERGMRENFEILCVSLITDDKIEGN